MRFTKTQVAAITNKTVSRKVSNKRLYSTTLFAIGFVIGVYLEHYASVITLLSTFNNWFAF